MKKKYLEGLALKTAYKIFGEAVEIFGHPHKYNEIEDMERYIICAVETRGYNEEEQELIKENLKKILREYKNECSYHDICYR